MSYLYVLLAYLLGSIPFGLLLAGTVGVDIRAAGSGNIGATNVNRLLGKKLGALTLLADVGKGLLPVVLAGRLLEGAADREVWMLLCGGAAFFGHLFPVYLKFKGGKGVATALGVFLAINPVVALASLLVFVAVVRIWGYVSLGSITAAALLPVWVWIFLGSLSEMGLAFMIGLLIWFKHSANISRLRQGEEKSWKKSSAPAPESG